MESMSAASGLGGLGNALDIQKFAADVISKTLDGQGQSEAAAARKTGAELGQAVPGVGGKLDVEV